jgi:hypothetical protein
VCSPCCTDSLSHALGLGAQLAGCWLAVAGGGLVAEFGENHPQKQYSYSTVNRVRGGSGEFSSAAASATRRLSRRDPPGPCGDPAPPLSTTPNGHNVMLVGGEIDSNEFMSPGLTDISLRFPFIWIVCSYHDVAQTDSISMATPGASPGGYGAQTRVLLESNKTFTKGMDIHLWHNGGWGSGGQAASTIKGMLCTNASTSGNWLNFTGTADVIHFVSTCLCVRLCFPEFLVCVRLCFPECFGVTLCVLPSEFWSS